MLAESDVINETSRTRSSTYIGHFIEKLSSHYRQMGPVGKCIGSISSKKLHTVTRDANIRKFITPNLPRPNDYLSERVLSMTFDTRRECCHLSGEWLSRTTQPEVNNCITWSCIDVRAGQSHKAVIAICHGLKVRPLRMTRVKAAADTSGLNHNIIYR